MSKFKLKMKHLLVIFTFYIISSCSDLVHVSFFENRNLKEGVAIVTNNWWNRNTFLEFNIFLEYEKKTNFTEYYYNFGSKISVGFKYKAYYYTEEQTNKYYIDFTQPLFEGYKISETLCLVEGGLINNIRGRKLFEIRYDLGHNGRTYKSCSFFYAEDYKQNEVMDFWFKTKYATSNPAFSHLQIDTPYTTKENTDLKIIDIGDKTTSKLNKAARKLQSGGTLYWTTSNIDLSDEAEINQEELNKMNQFLETYEPKGLLGRKLVIKVDIVDHRNIGEVLVPVEREKIEE